MPVVAVDHPAAGNTSRTIAVTSGKGGVGKSNIALNLAIALAETGSAVCLLDANLGLGNIDLLCGLNGYWNLSHVVTGARTLDEVVLDGPQGVHVVPGASGLSDLADCPPSVQRDLLGQLEELERTHEFLIIDTGPGIHQLVRRFVTAADLALIVTTPEPTALADAYATVKALAANVSVGRTSQSVQTTASVGWTSQSVQATADSPCSLTDGLGSPSYFEAPARSGPLLEVLVNQADSPEQGRAILERLQQTSRLFLQAEVGSAGSVPRDPSVPAAVARRTPFLIDSPHSPAANAVQRLARRMKNVADTNPPHGSFLTRWLSPANPLDTDIRHPIAET